jgi:hypothetical protein
MIFLPASARPLAYNGSGTIHIRALGNTCLDRRPVDRIVLLRHER